MGMRIYSVKVMTMLFLGKMFLNYLIYHFIGNATKIVSVLRSAFAVLMSAVLP